MNNPKSRAQGASDVRRVAVVGGGISGVAAAHRLAESVDVTLFEAQRRPLQLGSQNTSANFCELKRLSLIHI